jgi:hypothetical protein
VNGGRIVLASWIGTGVLAVSSLLSVTLRSTDLVATIVALVMFAAGVAIFLLAYGSAVGRSRTDEIGIGGLYFLQTTAPRPVQLRLLGSLAAEMVIAFVAVGIRPFSSVAFGVLAPMWGLGLCGLWGARHGRFGPRSGREESR